jgi:decaprenyl-phosphate phosphoribosyltransferase
VRACRPYQWVKNLLVLAAPIAATVITHPPVLVRSLAAAAVFTVASAGIYLINDVRDAPQDRLHPIKRTRPVASGALPARTAVAVGAVLIAVALVAAVPIGSLFAATVATYLILSTAYSLGLKRVPLLEILLVAGGFLIRAIAGGAANHIPLSRWFLLVSGFGALLVVAGKRRAEQVMGGAEAARHRSVNAHYPPDWLAQTVTVSLTATVLGYCLWAFQYIGTDVFQPTLALSTIPFGGALLRYTLLVSQGKGDQPERLLTTDRFLLGCLGLCAALVLVSLYMA